MKSLFESPREIPFPALLLPETLKDFLGQPHLMGEKGYLRGLLERQTFRSMVIYGPPGCGKSSFVRILEKTLPFHFETVRAGEASGGDLRKAIDRALSFRQSGQEPLLVIEEIDRFTRVQQDALVPALERGDLKLLGLSFDNPVKALLPPLASRLLVFSFHPLDPTDLTALLEKGRIFLEKRQRIRILIDHGAHSILVRRAGGDGRKLLITLEGLLAGKEDVGEVRIDAEMIRRMEGGTGGVFHDAETHYDLISAFIKSVRNHDPDAAVHYLARMLEAGEDPLFISRRLVILAAEDIGLANPMALPVAVACLEAVRSIGLPEARIPMAETTVYLALSLKSNSAYKAIDRALAEVREGFLPPVPAFLKNVQPPDHSGGIRTEEKEPYIYPHDAPGGVSRQSGLPEGHHIYRPGKNVRGEEQEMIRRLEEWRRIKKDSFKDEN